MSAAVEVWTLAGRSTIELEGERATIGTAPENDFALADDRTVSGLHAVLERFPAGWCVTDLGSSNGTYVADTVGTLPKTPVTPGRKQEIPADGQVYVGAWTRITIRKAAPGEVS